MASNLSLKTVAEGIEDQDTAQLLIEMGCDYAQGYRSKPVTKEEFQRIILKEKMSVANKLFILSS